MPPDDDNRPVLECDCRKRFGLLRAFLVVAITVMLVAAGLAGKAALSETETRTKQQAIVDVLNKLEMKVDKLVEGQGRIKGKLGINGD